MAIFRLFDGLLNIGSDVVESAAGGTKRGLFEFDDKPAKLLRPEIVGGMSGFASFTSKLDEPDQIRAMQSLKLAQDMFRKGEANDDILARTGFWFDENNNIKYEIDDSKAEMLIPFEDLKANRYVLAKDLLKHDKFYSFYPELADTPINFYRGKETEVGGFNIKTGEIDLNLNSASMIDGDRIGAISDLLHEVQHAVQKVEKFSQGGSKEQFLKTGVEPTDKEREEAFNKYMRLAGEAEARNVAFRYADPKYNKATELYNKIKGTNVPTKDATKNKNFLQTLTKDPLSQKYGVTVPQLTDNRGNPVDMRADVLGLGDLRYNDPLERTI
jgi:hypothetical protein